MKSAYMVAYFITILILLICMIQAGRSNKKIAPTVRNVLIAAEVSVVANLVLALTDLETICNLSYSMFFISIDVLLVYLVRFAMLYTNEIGEITALSWILTSLIGLDVASLFLNVFFQHAFSLYRTSNVTLYYYITKPHIPFQLHLLLCYILLGIVFVCLLKKILNSAAPYQRKYFLVLISLIAVVCLDAVNVFFQIHVDSSMFTFALAGLVVYYYSLVYVPKRVIKQTLMQVVQEMGDAVIVFDVDGNCIHVNNSAKNLFQISKKDVENLDTSFSGWNHLMDSEKRKDSKGITTVAWKEKTYQVKADLRRLMDKRNRYMGCFLVIQDRTEEVLRLQKEHFRATHDILTGLYNKEHFYELVGEELEENSEEGYYIICSDIKEFKLINDVFGPRAGDDIIKKVAQALREKTTQGDIYCRLESDKFGLFVKKNTFDISKFSRYVEEGIKIDSDVSYPVHVYIGIFDIIDISLPVSVMCDRAFMALKSIKGGLHPKDCLL